MLEFGWTLGETAGLVAAGGGMTVGEAIAGAGAKANGALVIFPLGCSLLMSQLSSSLSESNSLNVTLLYKRSLVKYMPRH